MKITKLTKTWLAALSLAMLMPMTACGQNRLLTDLPKGDGIETVYVGRGMLRLAGGMSSLVSDPNVRNAIKSINSVEVVNVESPKYFAPVKASVQKLVDQRKMKLLVSSEEGREVTHIYGQMNPEGTVINTMVVVNQEAAELNVVVLQGNIDPAKFIEN